MANFSQNNIQWLMLGNSSTVSDTGRAVDAVALATGEVGVFDASGQKLINSSTAQRFMVVQENGSSPVFSEIIDPTTVTDVRKVLSAAAVEQVDIIGYNGTAGAIEVGSTKVDNIYMANINVNQSLASAHGGIYLKHAVFGAVGTPTQEGVANGLNLSVLNNFKHEADTIIKPEMLCDEAGTAMGAIQDLVVGTAGSKTVTVTHAAAAADVENGDYFRIGNATTDPVYKIKSSTVTGAASGILVLETPLQETFALKGTTTKFITSAAGLAAEWGLKLTGVAKKFDNGKLNHGKASWNLTLKDFGTTTYTASAASSTGAGTYEQVAEMEFFLQGNGGNTMRTPEPLVHTRRNLAEAASFYNLYEISYTTKEERGYGAMHAPKHLTIAVNVGTTAGAAGPSWVSGTAGLEATIEQMLGVTL
tara:strand:+ start:10313 stop:11569 length:1257 start_codon:yes stop_codon:yes gene_type:complete